ncbi:hypothetical protein ACRALDRAFT_1064294 [Sodiomyces alcalophilus JCM 7366]|uniref:uncharacterized protein n=1 Tax=Sodiomyces alcalophilus JCM 7366 TaxID=591952 RepID=UPI0039B4F46B
MCGSGTGSGGMEEARTRELLDPWPELSPQQDERSLYTSGIGSTRSTYHYYQSQQQHHGPAELDESSKYADGARQHYREPPGFVAELPASCPPVRYR